MTSTNFFNIFKISKLIFNTLFIIYLVLVFSTSRLFICRASDLISDPDYLKRVISPYYYNQTLYCLGEDCRINQHYSDAFKFFTLAAEKGHTPSQSRLSYMYYKGIGTEKNIKHAIQNAKLAAQGGDVPSIHRLGSLYYRGIKAKDIQIEADLEKAITFFSQAARKGYIKSQIKLEEIYFNFNERNESFGEALKWWFKVSNSLGPENNKALAFLKKDLFFIPSQTSKLKYPDIKLCKVLNLLSEEILFLEKKSSDLNSISLENYKKVVDFIKYLREIEKYFLKSGFMINCFDFFDPDKINSTDPFLHRTLIKEEFYISIGEQNVVQAKRLIEIFLEEDEKFKEAIAAIHLLKPVIQDNLKNLKRHVPFFHEKKHENELNIIETYRSRIHYKKLLKTLQELEDLPDKLALSLKANAPTRNFIFMEENEFVEKL